MPIYEFYCSVCNTIYNFLSRSVNTEKIPLCPRCRTVKLERRMSVFSTIFPDKEKFEGECMPSIDESRMEKAMQMLAGEADRIDEDDPRQAVTMMRKLSEAAGLNLSSSMEEALNRIERGEDPEKIEEEMGDIFENEDSFSLDSRGGSGKRQSPPSVDDTLYDL
ncbi:MAG: zinc ribbon domain-containing protein [Deltaproteobacteria bacterium]|nr:zinc ribbon domain-containing protein [Deltaproteobacteria bacterium]